MSATPLPLDGPAMPIIGEGDEEPNDRYIEQLVASAKAAVDTGRRPSTRHAHRAALLADNRHVGSAGCPLPAPGSVRGIGPDERIQ